MVCCIACLEKAGDAKGRKRLEQFLAVRYGIFYKGGSRLSPGCVSDPDKVVNGHIPHA
ncbi:protein of unknown function [Candidatus Methylomirabilis oxygeniifera]|uniref:Uncharacterized protein n=1 Tax=Methylomirabilis oxygeniifera TaxID=671143 RepID=D5MM68_METO1|nr:protein of unknown function [Candidatus Methylomirabilis oxyfera]